MINPYKIFCQFDFSELKHREKKFFINKQFLAKVWSINDCKQFHSESLG